VDSLEYVMKESSCYTVVIGLSVAGIVGIVIGGVIGASLLALFIKRRWFPAQQPPPPALAPVHPYPVPMGSVIQQQQQQQWQHHQHQHQHQLSVQLLSQHKESGCVDL
jgi:hypothetical protein